jgi:hypothetical protein
MASFLNMYESIDAKTMAESWWPWALSPIEGRTAPDGANMFGLRHDKTLGLLSTSSSTVRQNRALVHRSWAFLRAKFLLQRVPESAQFLCWSESKARHQGA